MVSCQLAFMMCLCVAASMRTSHSFPVTSTALPIQEIHCAPFCSEENYGRLVYPDYPDVEPEVGSDVGNEYH
ncbi:hypothetical protein QR680_006304 [Steinernema hermaphroditum]|uniref:Secreted protein n=1 Tax=Steinernema hermaphroditum TaxID=289476 RepID=A0AA39HUZ3_9BILA|nr:hypothetical protein QR680_006304 [Steinernema hermaphroditum]